ncbi:MAG TPA: V-type ATP synthase subunit I [archaeon]|nr:V-type ATP synthase subunit I [archaeon]
MIKPQKMELVRIIGVNKNVQNVIETLYDMKVLHLVDFKKSEDSFLDIGKPMKDAAFYSEQLLNVKSMISFFKITGEPNDVGKFRESTEIFDKIQKEFKRLVDERDGLKSEENKRIELLNHPMYILGMKSKDVTGLSSVKVFIGKTKSSLQNKVEKTFKNYQLNEKEIEKEFSIALIVKKRDGEKAKELLSSSGFTEYQIIQNADFNNLPERLENTRKQIAETEKSLDELKRHNARFLLDYEFALTQLNEKAEAPLRFASTKNAFVATGWIPKNKADVLKESITATAKGKIEIETLETKMDPPIVLENVRPAKPFEFLLKLYSLPKYHEIDPTFIMFITYPLFFGFMLGDIGYGIISLILIMLVAPKFGRGFLPIKQIIIISSISTLVFGFVFGEFFGYEFTAHPIFNRVQDINSLLMITIGAGLFQITLGFVLGFINEYVKHGIKRAIFSKGSWLLLETGALMVALSIFNGMTALQLPGMAIFFTSILMLFKGEGLIGIIEMPTLLSNVLSYTRLYAFGLASISLATIINDGTFSLISKGGISIIAGIGIFFMGHTLNFLLGLVGAFLQSMRLHYVEFFTKFYEGGGYSYSPFGTTNTNRR